MPVPEPVFAQLRPMTILPEGAAIEMIEGGV